MKRKLERHGREVLEKQARRIEDEGGEVSGACLRQVRIYDEVLELTQELGANLLVFGSGGRSSVVREHLDEGRAVGT